MGSANVRMHRDQNKCVVRKCLPMLAKPQRSIEADSRRNRFYSKRRRRRNMLENEVDDRSVPGHGKGNAWHGIRRSSGDMEFIA